MGARNQRITTKNKIKGLYFNSFLCVMVCSLPSDLWKEQRYLDFNTEIVVQLFDMGQIM